MSDSFGKPSSTPVVSFQRFENSIFCYTCRCWHDGVLLILASPYPKGKITNSLLLITYRGLLILPILYLQPYDLEIRKQRTLYGHYAEVTCLVCCGEFRILASGSKDGTAILWDLDALTYIRSLTGHATAVSSMAISKTSGDICTVCNSGKIHATVWIVLLEFFFIENFQSLEWLTMQECMTYSTYSLSIPLA